MWWQLATLALSVVSLAVGAKLDLDGGNEARRGLKAHAELLSVLPEGQGNSWSLRLRQERYASWPAHRTVAYLGIPATAASTPVMRRRAFAVDGVQPRERVGRVDGVSTCA